MSKIWPTWQITVILGGTKFLRYPDGNFCGTRSWTDFIMPPKSFIIVMKRQSVWIQPKSWQSFWRCSWAVTISDRVVWYHTCNHGPVLVNGLGFHWLLEELGIKDCQEHSKTRFLLLTWRGKEEWKGLQSTKNLVTPNRWRTGFCILSPPGKNTE